jgi:glucokinase
MELIGAVDIGGTKIAAGVIDRSGSVLAYEQFPTAQGLILQEGVRRIIRSLESTSSRAGGVIQGIGIGCTGQLDFQTGFLWKNAFLPGWEGPALVQRLASYFRVQVAIDNDAVAAALAESAWGAGRGAANFIYVTISTGIGGAWVLNGRVHRSTGGAHPEIGHHIVQYGGPRCFCGAQGCWESMASGRAMAAWLASEFPEHAPRLPDARAICQAAILGDEAALAAVAHEGEYLGIGLANLITLFLPDVIALGGGVMNSYPLFIDRIWDKVRETCGLVPHQQVRILPAECGPLTGLMGAGRVWIAAHPS